MNRKNKSDCQVRLNPSLIPRCSTTNTPTAVVYLKNRVTRGWSPSEDSPQNKAIGEDEKLRFRERLLPVLASSPPRIRSQLVPVLQKILHHDFPEKWPAFINITVQLLNTNDASSVFAGLQCLLAICRVYRFKSGENRVDFDKIVEATFPRLLTIGQGLVNEMSEEAGEMLHIVLKAYKHATFVRLRILFFGKRGTDKLSSIWRSPLENSRLLLDGARCSFIQSRKTFLLLLCQKT